MQDIILDQIIDTLEKRLLDMGYAKRTMSFYKSNWFKILSYAKSTNRKYYTKEFKRECLKEVYNISVEKPFISESEQRIIRVFRMIEDYEQSDKIVCHYSKERQISLSQNLTLVRERYVQYLQDNKYSNCTMEYYVKSCDRFLIYLCNKGIHRIENLQIQELHYYLHVLVGYSKATIRNHICALKLLFKIHYDLGYLKNDIASKMPAVRGLDQRPLPSIWTDSEIEMLVKSIDRDSPLGKRDYAIILLACRLGLRCIDIKKLKITNCNWTENTLKFTQSKVVKTISLPLTKEVGWAIIDYLKNGRPDVKSPYIFIKHRVPYEPFSESCHLTQMITNYMNKAGIAKLNKKRGLHSMRHTLATNLLKNSTSLHLISDILGHSTMESTNTYLKVDIERLRECALDSPIKGY